MPDVHVTTKDGRVVAQIEETPVNAGSTLFLMFEMLMTHADYTPEDEKTLRGTFVSCLRILGVHEEVLLEAADHLDELKHELTLLAAAHLMVHDFDA